MEQEKYTTTHMAISAILGLIKANDIAVPEIQRPFVWKARQVRDLMDSLYKGYPVGYIILWKNPNVRLKDGTISAGKKVLIDGQQRVTALMTSIAGHTIINEYYRPCRIKIAFDPFAALQNDEEAEIFAVHTPAHLKSKRWIPDIAEIFADNYSSFKFIPQYCKDNPDIKPETLERVIDRLKGITAQPIGIIELSSDLQIDVVTDIFVRINSKGTALNQGDFVMSKIAADKDHDGNTLRKIVDYFCHLAVEPSFFHYLTEHDPDFCSRPERYIDRLSWLKDDNETVYDPQCDDLLRVAFMYKFKRSKLGDLVSLLSGRNFETREYQIEIIDKTYSDLFAGVLDTVSENNFKQFMLAVKGAGFISPRLINSVMALDFAYTLYLILHDSNEVSVSEVKHVVQKWYVLSVLTGRYSSSPESAFYKDLLRIKESGVVSALNDIESAVLSENFWNVQLTQDLAATSTKNPVYLVYLAAQVHDHDISLLSGNITVRELIELGGDVHHIFPKQYLIDNDFDRNLYNQDANYAFLDRPVNESIGKKAPKEYFSVARRQCAEMGVCSCGSIRSLEELEKNMAANCIPLDVFDMDCSDYERFLIKRRELMAEKIRRYYYSL